MKRRTCWTWGAPFSAITLAAISVGVIGRPVAACDDCGCQSTAAATCTHHVHADGSTHSHDHEPAPGMGSGGAGSYYQWDVPTTPAPGAMRYTVLGDTQGLSILDQLVVDMNAYNPEFFIQPGDLVSTGGAGSWDNWLSITDSFNGERYMVPGNHDLPVGGDALWKSKFSFLPDSQIVDGKQGIDKMDYYFDRGNARFVSVTTDSQANGAGGQPAALDWLEAVLNDPATQAKEHVFVYSHHPVTYQNLSGTGGTAGDWWQTMADSGVVDAFYAGHWHLYQPSQPDPNSSTWEAVLGTGGGSLEGFAWQFQHGFTVVDVKGPRVEATFFGDADGDGAYDDVMDQFVIADSTPKPNGLVGYYSFNFGNSNLDTATGPLAKQNHGAYADDATTVSGGILGKALSVDGVGDYAHGGSIGDYTMAILDDLTISLYANFDSLSLGANQNTLVSYSGRIPVIGGGGVYGPQESTNHPYHLSIRDDRRLQVMWEYDNATQEVVTSTAAVNVDAGEWGHYMIVRDAQAMEVRFYVDGVQLGAAVSFSQLPTGGANGFLHIGNGIDGDTGFAGFIDELTIYDAALLPEQIFVGPLPGDLDGNGIVELLDFTANFLPNFGTVVGSPGDLGTLAMGDLDVDGDVDLLDFDAFQGVYLDANPGAAPLSLRYVPEPASLLIVGVGCVLLPVIRRGQRKRVSRLLTVVAIPLLIGPGADAASLIRDYQFSGNLSDSLGGPALVSGGGVLATNGYLFDQNTGLSLSNWDPTGQGDDYAIEMYLTVDSETMAASDYQKMIDFKNRTSDDGFYLVDRELPDYRLTFFGANVGNGPDAFFPDTFHHLVLSRDSLGSGTLSAWLDGQLQWSAAADSNSVADAPGNILYFLRDEGLQFRENPAGYVDFLRIYDGGVSQAEVDAMVAGLPQYGSLEVSVDKLTGVIDIANEFPEPLTMRAYQITSASGELDTSGWVSWDEAGLDGNTWFEANPSGTQLAELNLTSSGAIPVSGSRTLGAGYGGGFGGNEDLVFEYLEPGNPTSITIPITYVGTPTFIVGDLNFDSNINAADWMLYIAGQHKDLAGMTMFEAFQMGDMDDDFDNDHTDFVLFKTAFEQANGAGSFAAMLATVPEPSAWASGFAAFFALTTSRCRQARGECTQETDRA